MNSRPVGVGIIGAGMISAAYLRNLTRMPDVQVLAVGDLDVERARHQAAAFGVPRSGDPQVVLTAPDVEVVVNLTVPAVHAAVSLQVLAAGKHVWSEKPLAVDRRQAHDVLVAARSAGLRVGVAPDTLLGPGFQRALRLVEQGAIGRPLSASTVMQYMGPERMHPNPSFLYSAGAGPLFDMGPYYLGALVGLLGPVDRVAALGSRARGEREVRVGDRTGSRFPVEVDTHVVALLEFSDGGVAESTLSFDSPFVRNGVVEVTGTEGCLVLSDPNSFDGVVRLTTEPPLGPWPPQQHWREFPADGHDVTRGLGVLDLVRSLREDRPHRASAELGLHVLDSLLAVEESVRTRRFVPVESTVQRAPLLPEGWDPLEQTL